MGLILKVLAMIISAAVFGAVIYMLVRRRLNESNSVLWLLIAVIILVFGFFPGLLDWMADTLGIGYAPSLLFFVSTLILMLIVFKGSLQLSKISAEMNELAITVSILKEENKRLAARLADKTGDKTKDLSF